MECDQKWANFFFFFFFVFFSLKSKFQQKYAKGLIYWAMRQFWHNLIYLILQLFYGSQFDGQHFQIGVRWRWRRFSVFWNAGTAIKWTNWELEWKLSHLRIFMNRLKSTNRYIYKSYFSKQNKYHFSILRFVSELKDPNIKGFFAHPLLKVFRNRIDTKYFT